VFRVVSDFSVESRTHENKPLTRVLDDKYQDIKRDSTEQAPSRYTSLSRTARVPVVKTCSLRPVTPYRFWASCVAWG